MDLDWLRHPAASGVLALTADPRPAWLWTPDGETLLWRNGAAALLGARTRAAGLAILPPARPIKGQVARIVRLGLVNQPIRSRVQFLAGRTPLAAPCVCTPISFGESGLAVLIVADAPIDPAILETPEAQPSIRPLIAGAGFALDLPDGHRIAERDGDRLAKGDPHDFRAEGDSMVARFPAGPQGAVLAIALPMTEADLASAAPEASQPESEPEPAAAIPEAAGPTERSGLADLLDRLSQDEALYSPLDEGDDRFDPDLVHDHALTEPEDDEPLDAAAPDAETWQEVAEEDADELLAEDRPDEPVLLADEPEDSYALEDSEEEPLPGGLWQVTGRGLTLSPGAEAAAPEPETETEPQEAPPAEAHAPEAPEEAPPAPPSPPETMDRVSRYNFEELSRILTDRVGREPEPYRPETAPAPKVSGSPVVPLSDESLVLNRIPLGILVFRDQDIVFVNRALVDLTGHPSASAVRAAGLSAVIPSTDGEALIGPVSQLLRADGGRIAVQARLQSVSWQGRPAFMLSARVADTRPQDEPSVKAFARLLAGALGADFFEADPAGILSGFAPRGETGAPTQRGDTLAQLVAPQDRVALRAFLDAPARRAETQRPMVRLAAQGGGAVVLFTEGRAGLVSGYFGFLLPERRAPQAVPARAGDGLSSDALVRISREVRGPLNTILGFSEIMAGESFGPLGSERYREYARDIESAGRAISDLADELDEFVTLAGAQHPPAEGEVVDLAALLSVCLSKIRAEAIAARVLLRSSISERLPRVRVDAPTLSQAVLNLLASAIRHTESGGRVVLSAQQERSGAVAIHVRDTATTAGDIADRFVVFREGRERDGTARQPTTSSIGLTLTRSLIAVNALSFSIDPATDTGTLMTLVIPADRVVAED